VNGGSGIPGWQDVTRDAPRIARLGEARLGEARLGAARLAMLGTLRRDGSPRISPVEPCIAGGQLLIGAMTRSAKAADLQRDPRYVLHSVVADPDSGEGELKLYGSAAIATPQLARTAAGAWWLDWPPERAVIFSLGIWQADFVEWDTTDGLMTVHRWTPQGGYSQSGHAYPLPVPDHRRTLITESSEMSTLLPASLPTLSLSTAVTAGLSARYRTSSSGSRWRRVVAPSRHVRALRLRCDRILRRPRRGARASAGAQPDGRIAVRRAGRVRPARPADQHR